MTRARGRPKGSEQVKYFLLIFIMVAANMVIMLPLSSPKARAYEHLGSASLEDGNPDYDSDGEKNHVVVWYGPDGTGQNHTLSTNYVVNPGYTLIIPPLDHIFRPDLQCVISLKPSAWRIDVYGTLLTNTDATGPVDYTNTAFMSEVGSWDGIYFHPASRGRIIDTQIWGATNGIVFEPDSILESPGIKEVEFTYMYGFGMQLDGVVGHTYISNATFYDTVYEKSTSLLVKNCSLNVRSSYFHSHPDDQAAVHISNANVHFIDTYFIGHNQSGNIIHIEGHSNGTRLDNCLFMEGTPGDHFIRIDGASPFIDNCTFKTRLGENSVIANDDGSGIPSHPVIRNPTDEYFNFDNATLNATGASSITLQWYMHVYVKDPDDNLIPNAFVWVEDRIGNPADPFSKPTNIGGWARWFTVTEFILYSDSITNFNPFKVSALNNSVIGYADPEPAMNVTKEVTVIVPFNPLPNTPPEIIWLTTPFGIQTRDVLIEFILSDPNSGDDGNLSIMVFYSTDLKTWTSATPSSGSGPTTLLSNGTLYYFVWDSYTDLPDLYNTTVYLMIIPCDRAGQGPSNQTGNFTLDNKAPEILSGPFITPTNTTALIEWIADEPSNATVSYGFWGTSLSNEVHNTSWTVYQTVTLTGLQPGRLYNYSIKLKDIFGHEFISQEYSFETEIRIPLYEGWNMISLPPFLSDVAVEDVLASIAGEYDIVEAYDASDSVDPWKCYNIYKPEELNDLHEISSFMGLWIHVLNDTVLIPDHTDPSVDPMFPGTYIRLFRGWNFVGYPSVKTRTVFDALSGVLYKIVQTYDAASGEWWSWVSGISGKNISWEMRGLSEPFDAERLANGDTLIVDSGDNRVIEVDGTGTIVWEYGGLDYPTDAESLENGNKLIAEYGSIFSSGRIIELDSSDNIVWEYVCDYSPFDVERLDNGNTLITETDLVSNWGRVIEVNSGGIIVWETELDGSLMDAERLANGNTLIAEFGGNRVVEVDINGIEVWEWAVSEGPWDVEKFANSNTLICEGSRIVEIDNADNIRWQVSGLAACTDAERLDNGNVLITERDQNRVFEIDCSCDLTELEMGRGYWIHCMEDHNWHIDYV